MCICACVCVGKWPLEMWAGIQRLSGKKNTPMFLSVHSYVHKIILITKLLTLVYSMGWVIWSTLWISWLTYLCNLKIKIVNSESQIQEKTSNLQPYLLLGVKGGRCTLQELSCPPPGVLPNPGIETRSPKLQVHFLPAEPPGTPKNTGVSSLCLLQGNFLTQESNRGLLHCRQILYQLSYQGSPDTKHISILNPNSHHMYPVRTDPLSLVKTAHNIWE